MPESYLLTLSPREETNLAARPLTAEQHHMWGTKGGGLASKNVESCNESQLSNSSSPALYGKLFPDTVIVTTS
jgi:hypothetical protein